MRIQILIDNINSWIIPYAQSLELLIKENFNHYVEIIHKHEDVSSGDILILLSCERKFKKLSLNKFNLVVHESKLPLGKGWSPLTWQILEGSNRIPISLFEAADEIDSGPIYIQEFIELSGKELLPELKDLQGNFTNKIIIKFLENIDKISKTEQIGESTFYPRRTKEDSQLDINKSIKDQFNLLRVCDNERYPAFFLLDGQKYILKIFKED
ncbi:hypothetical protein [Aquirufa ecclesiirivi]|uniref:hypothetical protein n=1 Tax=Aquirufa ecclesiirivi TaxID=2715124 RepID=UPI0023D86A65|nr:hypothetical protein [Aquirufa ecclesiirivi]MDF0692489.1 hypothetical protein [Aquirufa ecclesiirivi]